MRARSGEGWRRRSAGPTATREQPDQLPSHETAGLGGIISATKGNLPLLALLVLCLLARIAWTEGQWPVDWTSAAVLVPAFGFLAVLEIAVIAVAHAFQVTSRDPGEFAAFRLET
jgi:hypothetical protein